MTINQDRNGPRPLYYLSIRPTLEFGLVAILMLAFSPMASKAQWGVLILPGFCLSRLAITRRDPIVICFFAIGWLAWLASQNFLGKNAVFVGLWYGAVLINALAWFIVCSIRLLNEENGVEDKNGVGDPLI